MSSCWTSNAVTGVLIGLWTNLLVARWIQKTPLSDRLLVRRDETFERHGYTACRLFGDLEFTPGFETDDHQVLIAPAASQDIDHRAYGCPFGVQSNGWDRDLVFVGVLGCPQDDLARFRETFDEAG